jgi:hypothetical protein
MLLSISQVSTFLTLFFLSLTDVHAQNTTLSPIILPAPPGPYVTRLEIQVMVDMSRPDPYNSTLKYNRLLTSIFTPVPKSQCSEICEAQYMPPAVAAYNDKVFDLNETLFERFKLSGICCGISPGGHNMSQKFSHDTYPLLVLSPGFRESRLEFSAIAQYVSSYGYKVITVDQPGEVSIVEFPDGEIVTTIFSNNSTIEQEAFALNVRTQDVLFIVDTFSKGKETIGQKDCIGTGSKFRTIPA